MKSLYFASGTAARNASDRVRRLPSTRTFRWLAQAAATLAQATASFALLGLAALAGFLQRDFKLTAAETGLLIAGGYAALWACVVAALALAYAVTRVAAK
jgi:hypothetical protein